MTMRDLRETLAEEGKFIDDFGMFEEEQGKKLYPVIDSEGQDAGVVEVEGSVAKYIL